MRKLLRGIVMAAFLLLFSLPFIALASFLVLYLMPNEFVIAANRFLQMLRRPVELYLKRVDALFDDLIGFNK